MLWMTWWLLQVTDFSLVGDPHSEHHLLFYQGHEVVWLPVSHCTLNPIELALAQVKGHIKTNAKMFNLTEVEKLAWEVFNFDC